jgi:hypothetical protein
VIAGVDQGGDGEAAASGLSCEGDVRWGGAVAQEGFVGGKSVVDRGRIRVLRGEPVVDGNDLGTCPSADLRGQASGLGGASQYVHAPMEVQDNMARYGPVDRDLGGRDAAQCGRGHGDVSGQRLRRGQVAEQSPLLIDINVGGEGGLPQDRFEVLLLLGAHGGSPSVEAGWAITRLAAKQVRRHHRITVIRAARTRHNRSAYDRRECGLWLGARSIRSRARPVTP